ncbi:MAG TPA: hypothetical protein VF818_08110 [Ktedonobacterales bacterium]
MQLRAAFTEFMYAKDYSPASKQWYTSRLGAFMSWAEAQGVADLDAAPGQLVAGGLA